MTSYDYSQDTYSIQAIWNAVTKKYEISECTYNAGTFSVVKVLHSYATWPASISFIGNGRPAHLDFTQVTGSCTVSGGAGDDFIHGGSGNDLLAGGAGNNSLFGGAGGDTLSGGAGDDFFDGGNGSDTVSYAAATGGVTVDLDNSGPEYIGGGQGMDAFANIENVIGSAFGDTFYSSEGNNSFNGGDGIDTVNYGWANSAVTVNLGLTGAQTIGGGMGVDTLVSIERIIGTEGDDILTGSSVNETFLGGGGDDHIDGGAGIDTADYSRAMGAVKVNLGLTSAQSIGGGEGVDTLKNIERIIGSAYNDTLTGGSGNDSFVATLGNDVINGSGGSDTVDFSVRPSEEWGFASGALGGGYIEAGPVSVNLATSSAQTIGGGFDTDTLVSIENVIGSDFSDTLSGNSGNNSISGGAGDDLLTGGAGNDTLDGGDGNDTVSYASATGGVTVDLSLTTAQTVGGGQGVDTLLNVENLIGSAYDDTLTGSAANNSFVGGAGNDVINGGSGTDTASYAGASGGVSVNLATTAAQTIGGGQGIDKLTSIESLVGSAYDDTLVGNSAGNVIEGGAGNDKLDGGAGADRVSYAGATGGVKVSLAISTAQTLGGGMGVDTLSNFENITGSAFNDTLTGNSANNSISGGAGNDVLTGGAGDDTLSGGDGTDTASYAGATGAVTVNLGLSGAQTVGGGLGVDKLSGIESLIGSSYNDTLTGNSAANSLNGGAGDDSLSGGAGADTLTGGAGNDKFDGGTGSDVASYGSASGGVTVNLGLSGAQTIGGGQGVDTLLNIESVIGSAYNDTLTGTSGANLLDGKAGTNKISAGGGNDQIKDSGAGSSINGGSGDDQLVLTRSSASPFTATFGSGSGTASDGTTFSNIENLQLTTGAGNDTVTFNALDLDSTWNSSSWNGEAGTDTAVIDLSSLSGVVSYTEISNTGCTFDSYDEILEFSNVENFVVTGTDAADSFEFATGNNSLYGGGGDDTAYLGLGANTFDGGAGSDTVRLSYATSGVNAALGTTAVQHPGGGITALTLINVEALYGSNFNDTLTGGDGDDTLGGGAGNDLIDGGAGTNTAAFYASPDSVYTGVRVDLRITGAQTVGGGQGVDTLVNIENLIGSQYRDTLNGSDGDNVLWGHDGDDYLRGNGGNDTLVASYGNQTLYGGTGSDTLDCTKFDKDGAVVTVDLSDTSPQSILFNSPWYTYTLQGIENVIGTNQSDQIRDSAGNNVITARDGDDEIHISAGGNDTVEAGAGEDWIYCGAALTSADMIQGDAGDDYLVLDGDYAGGVTFTSTTVVNVETIRFTAGHSYNIKIAEETVAAGQTLTVEGQDLGSSDAITFNAASDTDGNLDIEAGAGNDTFLFGAGFNANDTVHAGAGTDTIALDGEYSSLALTENMLENSEQMTLAAGHDYNLSLADDDALWFGQSLTVDGSAVGLGNTFAFDTTAGYGGGILTLIAGEGINTFSLGQDTETMVYASASQSTAAHSDLIRNFDCSADAFQLPGDNPVTGIDAAVTAGSVYANGSQEGDITHWVDSTALLAHHAVLFTPNLGDYAGTTFLVVDLNGTAGYQSGQDLVIRMSGMSGTLTAANFH